MASKRPFKKVLVPVSFHERTPAIFSYARRAAEVNDGEITLFHAVPTQSYRLLASVYRPEESGGANEDHALRVAKSLLEQLANRHLQGVASECVVRLSPNPAKATLDLQQELGSELVMMSKSQASEIGARLQGGLIEKLIRSSGCPVWCVSALERLATQEALKDVLAPVSLTGRSSTTVARLARSVAEAQGGKVTLLHVLRTDPSALQLHRDLYGFSPDEPVSLPKAQKAATARLEELAEAELAGVPHDVAVVIAYELAGGILDEERSRAPALITMATPGYTGFFQIVLGSAAETVARRAECSVMTIRVSP